MPSRHLPRTPALPSRVTTLGKRWGQQLKNAAGLATFCVLAGSPILTGGFKSAQVRPVLHTTYKECVASLHTYEHDPDCHCSYKSQPPDWLHEKSERGDPYGGPDGRQ